MKYLPGLAFSCNPPDLCLPSSQYYRHEPPAPSHSFFFFFFAVLGLEFEAYSLSHFTSPFL
jgi:hypothetical protein